MEPLSPEALHEWTVDMLLSGETYPKGYRAAFAYPTAERLPLLG